MELRKQSVASRVRELGIESEHLLIIARRLFEAFELQIRAAAAFPAVCRIRRKLDGFGEARDGAVDLLNPGSAPPAVVPGSAGSGLPALCTCDAHAACFKRPTDTSPI